ncbi:hypothetical protein PR202_ga06544 [Eleusine coracana subsp. coracana]|uniref:Uncharacterized protein n=1 Tax=Eleusine coracana subsp. coracana TaxID=191504 RepID=A0AAV5BX04_ELECO|nr:hypothetical protein PR202_ga06544 [Eleusine coracana subsp. coracana]
MRATTLSHSASDGHNGRPALSRRFTSEQRVQQLSWSGAPAGGRTGQAVHAGGGASRDSTWATCRRLLLPRRELEYFFLLPRVCLRAAAAPYPPRPLGSATDDPLQARETELDHPESDATPAAHRTAAGAVGWAFTSEDARWRKEGTQLTLGAAGRPRERCSSSSRGDSDSEPRSQAIKNSG